MEPPRKDPFMNPVAHEVVPWKVSDLQESPYQDQLFGDLVDAELDELAADMAANGQRDPIHVLPSGVVVDGHQRRRVAMRLGWATVAAVVRSDLANAGADEIERAMIHSNLHRRQLDPLAIARLYKRLKQIERGWDPKDFYSCGSRDLRDQLAQRLGCRSGRSLDRYLKLLDAPVRFRTQFRSMNSPCVMRWKWRSRLHRSGPPLPPRSPLASRPGTSSPSTSPRR